MNGYFITGTDTGVGKTVVTAALGLLFQKQNKKVGVMKPVATGGHEVNGALVSEDAEFLKKTLKVPTTLELINPLCLKEPLAPKIAAEFSGHEISIAPIKIAYEYQRDKERPDVMLIEGVGGILVPIRHDYLVIDMIRDFKFPVIIVARAGVGTINHTLLTTSFLKQEKIPIAGIIFNHAAPGEKGVAEKTNPGEIQRLSGLPILGEVSHYADSATLDATDLAKHLDITRLL